MNIPNNRRAEYNAFIEKFPEMINQSGDWEFFAQTSNVRMHSFVNDPVAQIEFENGNGAYLLRYNMNERIPSYYIVPYVQKDGEIEFPGDNRILVSTDWINIDVSVGVEDALVQVKDNMFSYDPELKNNIPQFVSFVSGVEPDDFSAIRYNYDYYDLNKELTESNGNIVGVVNGVIDKYDMTLDTENPMGMVLYFENGRALSLQFDMDEYSEIISKVEVVPFIATDENTYIKDSHASYCEESTNYAGRITDIIHSEASKEVATAEEIERLINDKANDTGFDAEI